MKTIISVKKLNGIVVNPQDEGNEQIALSLNASLMQLGYIMSEDLLNAVKSLSEDAAEALYNELIPVLKEMKGADKKYVPLYPNFPQQVMEMEDAELYRNAILHYWSNGTWKPNYEALPKQFAYEETTFKTLELKAEEDFNKVFTRLVGSNASISDEDRTIVEWFIDKHDTQEYPTEIPFKENLCLIVGKLLEKNQDITGCIKTATDVLRVITYLSDGDVSLAQNTKFRSLPRSARKLFVSTLENVINEDDINRHKNKWGKLFHSLHVGEYKTKAPKVFEIAQKIRENKSLETFNSKVENALDNGNATEILDLLSNRPGEFARRLDHILRLHERSRTKTIETFLSVANKVSTRVLFQLLGHFNARKGSSAIDKRVVFPKGSVAKAIILRNELPAFGNATVNKLVKGIEKVLVTKFSEGEDLGKVYLDPKLKSCPLPLQQRNASSGLFTVARGTRMNLGTKDTVRMFIHWIGQDVDLSASFHKEDFTMVDQVSYTRLRGNKVQAVHGGDITRAPSPAGAAEFVDFSIKDALEKGVRYVVMHVYSFSDISYCEMESCYAGWMMKSKPNANEIYDAKTVNQKIDLSSESKVALPVVFDLETREAVWCDLAHNERSGSIGPINLESNKATTTDLLEAMLSLENKPTLHQLFRLHAEARGTEFVDKAEDADTVFSWEVAEGKITPYDIDVINSEYLA